MGLEIYLGGKKHFITSERTQILDLLISSYAQAIQLNEELKLREKEVSALNANLELRAAELEAANKELEKSPRKLRCPMGGVLAVIDRDGIILSRYPEAAGRVGQKLRNPQILSTMAGKRAGIIEGKGPDGAACSG